MTKFNIQIALILDVCNILNATNSLVLIEMEHFAGRLSYFGREPNILADKLCKRFYGRTQNSFTKIHFRVTSTGFSLQAFTTRTTLRLSGVICNKLPLLNAHQHISLTVTGSYSNRASLCI